MSLTSHLKSPQSPIGQFLRTRFWNTKSITVPANRQVRAAICTLPPTTVVPYPYQHVGMAVDYRLRYFFTPTPSTELVAWQGAQHLLFSPGVPTIRHQDFMPDIIERHIFEPYIIERFFTYLDKFIATRKPANRRLEGDDAATLARYCFVLGLFEEVYRSEQMAEELNVTIGQNSVDALLGIPPVDVVEDIVRLANLFFDRCAHLLPLQVVLNPTFAGSRDIGGADADLIADGCLIDIKTTKAPGIDTEWLRQLVGYLLLDYDDGYAIRTAGIYLARHGELLTWSVDDLLRNLTGDMSVELRGLRNEFRTLCRSLRRLL